MNPEQQNDTRSDRPVAYDTEGRPLYAAPQSEKVAAPGAQVVHFTRAVEPERPALSEAVQKKHEESLRQFPGLNLSEGEYVISAVKRHPIGLVLPVLSTALLIGLIVSGLLNFEIIEQTLGITNPIDFGSILFIGVLAILLALAGGYIAVWVYLSNQFFLTNESVIQEIQVSLFARREQTVSLSNIEDASYHQHGILQTLLNYGSIRLSTEGDETTYRFYYVANPRHEIAILNNAVEAFKNGRPIDTEDQD